MPRKLQDSQDWKPEESANKKAKVTGSKQKSESDLVTIVVNVIKFLNDPSGKLLDKQFTDHKGSTYTSIVKQLDSQDVDSDSTSIRNALKAAVESGQLTQPNRARWKLTIVEPTAPALTKPAKTNEPEPENRSFVGLSRDIAIEIMAYLSMQEIFRLRRVCKGWLELVESRGLWKKINLVQTGEEFPISVVDYLLKLANKQVELFTLDDTNVYINQDDLDMSSILETLFLSKDFLSQLEFFNLDKFSCLDNILQCTNIHTLTLIGSASQEIASLEKIAAALPKLQELTIGIHISSSNKKRRLAEYATKIQWPSTMQSLHIETDNHYYFFNIPKELVEFSIKKTETLEEDFPLCNVENIEDLFTHKLQVAELYDIIVTDRLLKLLQENSPNIQTFAASLEDGNRRNPQPPLELTLPELTSLTLIHGGATLKLDCPNLQSLNLKDVSNLEFSIASLNKLTNYSSDSSHYDKKLLKKAPELLEAQVETVRDFDLPKIEVLTTSYSQYNSELSVYKTLKVLNIQNAYAISKLSLELPVLEELNVTGKIETLSIGTPNLKNLDLSGCDKLEEIKNLSEKICNLKSLQIADASLKCLSFLKPQELYLVNREMQSEDLDRVVACESTEKICFNVCEMTDKGIIRFANGLGAKLKVLTLIDEPLSASSFTDKVIHTIAKACSQLEELNIEGCSEITGKAVHDLALTCKHLKTIRVTKCPRASKATILKGLDNPQFELYVNYKRII